jgi:hypothetical protein
MLMMVDSKGLMSFSTRYASLGEDVAGSDTSSLEITLLRRE